MMFCRHKHARFIGNKPYQYEVWYCPDCGKYNESNKYTNDTTGWKKKPSDIGYFCDGYHTFNQLYHQRAMLFATIVKQNKDHAWKTHKHEDGEPCFGGGWFLVTVDTPEGAYGYHYEDRYWDLFDCEEIPVAKHWDGYTEADVGRLLSLVNNP